MNHDYVKEHSLIERYWRGDLPAEEEARFEVHLMDCAACQEELEAAHGFARGMKSVAAAEAARMAVGGGILAFLARRGVVLSAAVVLALAAVFGLGLLRHENQRLESRLAELTAAGESPTTLTAPLAAVPVTLLGVVRGEDEPAPVTDPGRPYSLAVDVGADPRPVSYAVEILDAEGVSRFARRGLSSNDLEVLQITFPSGFLPPGEYRLAVEGLLPGGESIEIGGYAFALSPVPDP